MLFPAPLVDQLSEPTMDGGPDEAAQSNCVPACLSSALMGFFPGRAYDGDELRDAVYGEGSSGGTDPVRYIPYLAGQGVRTTEFDSPDGWALVHTIVAGLQRGEPVTGPFPACGAARMRHMWRRTLGPARMRCCGAISMAPT